MYEISNSDAFKQARRCAFKQRLLVPINLTYTKTAPAIENFPTPQLLLSIRPPYFNLAQQRVAAICLS